MHGSLLERDVVIYHEMMTHPALFTHPRPEKIAILDDADQDILQEVLKHKSIINAWHISKQIKTIHAPDSKVNSISSDDTTWITQIEHASLDILIIAAQADADKFTHYFDLLRPNGILIQQSESPFQLQTLKTIQQKLYSTGFHDTQTLQFPQPSFTSGWRCAIMAIKQSGFKRPREKDIFNRTFQTHYYNLDIHKAALALPEFMRSELLFKN